MSAAQQFIQGFLRLVCHFHLFSLDSDFEELLTLLHWPSISPPMQPLTPPANAQEISSQLDLLVSQLMALQTSYPLEPSDCQRHAVVVVGDVQWALVAPS